MQFEPSLKDGSMLAAEAEADSLYSRDWLAGTSSYQATVEALQGSDPRLRSRDPKAITEKVPWVDHGRVAILEMGVDGSFGAATEFRDVDRLRAHLAQAAADKKAERQRRRRDASGHQPYPHPHHSHHHARPRRRVVYIAEGMGPGFVGALGEHLGLHPSAFLDQERVIVMNTNAQGESDEMLLPSLCCPTAAAASARHADERHITLKYFEALQFDRCPDNFRLVCGDTGRHIGVSRTDGCFTDVGVVRRKCTLWTRRTADGNGNSDGDGDGDWECLVLCDPPVRSVRTGFEYRDLFPVKTKPYQGGYVDFVPPWAQAPGGPPRTCLLDDLVYYLQTHAAPLIVDGAYAASPPAAMADPDIVVGTFVRKIVASHYLKLAGHVRAVLSSAQRALSRKHDLSSLPMEKVEELWSDTQASERRVGEYGEDLEAGMLKLGIPLEKPYPGRSVAATMTTASSLIHSSTPSALSLSLPGPFLSPAASRPVYTVTDTDGPLEMFNVGSRSDTSKTLTEEPGFSMSRTSTGLKKTAGTVTEALSDDDDDDDDGLDLDEDEKRERADALRHWLDPAVDFQFLLLRFRELRHRTECLNSAVTGLASITGNRQAYHEQQLALEAARRSIREAKSSKAVTLLGLIFIPLAYTSSLFSMTEPYGPGGSEFWQYFVTSAPLIFVVLAAYYVLDAGYTDDGTGWSLAVFRKTMHVWCDRLRRRNQDK